ncbi:OB-fold domain-containing protein [Streptomyces sp. NPDC047117]|uniref:Zn-ribbon domain-containing OB-fold protein n=1 Tax=Streptomyces sp. NPDC047117 TaxID=3155379 RepID=UPI00340F6088
MSEPTATAPARAYREGLDRGELRYQRCDHCEGAVFPPRVLCPDCGSQELTWERSAGRGTVYAATVVRARDGARGVVLVDLDEGFRMMSRVDGIDPATVEIGTTVRFTAADEGDERVAAFMKEAQR